MPGLPGAEALSRLTQVPIAHRGLHDAQAGVIENTASAFAAAIARNYAIECDLQLAGDGGIVVFHDDVLDRLTTSAGPLVDRTVAELKQVRIRESPDSMQTLPELLEQVNGRVAVIIELKSRWDGRADLAKRAARELRSYKGACALMSLDPKLIEALASFAPALPRGMVADRAAHPSRMFLPLSRRLELRNIAHLERTRPHFLAFDAVGLPWPPVRRFREQGGPVICWTVRSAQQASLARRYCDQVTFEGFLP
jgi:glycerophosphoryl diester phosphodiesterase